MKHRSRNISSSAHKMRKLDECQAFAHLAERARKREQLNIRLCRSLPDALRDHVKIVDLKHQRLLFLVPTSAWASRLRLHQVSILEHARKLGVKASSIGIKVAPIPVPPTIKTRQGAPLSLEAARHLRQAASAATDPELKKMFSDMAAIASPDGAQSHEKDSSDQ